MRKRMIRLVLKWSLVLDALLFLGILADVFFLGGRNFTLAMILFVAFTLVPVVLLFQKDPAETVWLVRVDQPLVNERSKTVIPRGERP